MGKLVFKTKILATALLLLLSACGHKDDAASAPAPVTEAPAEQTKSAPRLDHIEFQVTRETSLNSDFSNEEEFKRNLNQRILTLRIPAELAENIHIVKTHTRSTEMTTEDIDTSGLFFEGNTATIKLRLKLDDLFLVPQTFTFEFSTPSQVLEPLQMTLQPDLLINKSRSFADLPHDDKVLTLDTLFFTEGAVLVTNHEDIQINALTIISRNGQVMTMTEHDVEASKNRDIAGTSGGSIKIYTTKFLGDIVFYMRGQNGATGSDGCCVRLPPFRTFYKKTKLVNSRYPFFS